MSVSLFLCGLGVQNGWNLTSFIMILIFCASFCMGIGSLSWLYVAEVSVDASSGLSVASQFLNLTIISFAFEYMINSAL